MEKKFDARTIAAMSTFISFGLSLPKQEMVLDAINEMISETKEAIISSDNTSDEVNALFDTLQNLTLKKYHTENRIAQLKRIHDMIEARDEASREMIVLKKDDRTLKEILEKT